MKKIKSFGKNKLSAQKSWFLKGGNGGHGMDMVVRKAPGKK